MKYLLNLNEKDDGDVEETDVFEPSMSHFAELFMEQEKMKVWYYGVIDMLFSNFIVTFNSKF